MESAQRGPMTVFVLAAMVHDVVIVCLRPFCYSSDVDGIRGLRIAIVGGTMSRLNYMQGCELAIHTVAEELGFQETCWRTVDGTAHLRSLMHADGNVQYANYQSDQQMIDYLTSQGYDENTWSDWIV